MSVTLGDLLAGELRRAPGPLGGLVLDLAAALKEISAILARGRLARAPGELARDLLLRACERGGEVAAIAFADEDEPRRVSRNGGQGRYFVACDPLVGAANLDANLTAGTIFSVLEAGAEGFLQRGARQVCAGFASYGPSTVLVLGAGRGVQGFTLERRFGEFVHTHAGMAIPEEARELAVDASGERFREAPLRRYVEEHVDVSLRWAGSPFAEVQQILVRGGLLVCPTARLELLCAAFPMAFLVEQAGGLASTGRGPLLDVVPGSLHERAPVVLGSRREVERLAAYQAAHDDGVDVPYTSPLFNVRSLLRES
jgi:fructose-1,6-bisphosphatase I / sedoheptulose-1,7-bisphosphatase